MPHRHMAIVHCYSVCQQPVESRHNIRLLRFIFLVLQRYSPFLVRRNEAMSHQKGKMRQSLRLSKGVIILTHCHTCGRRSRVPIAAMVKALRVPIKQTRHACVAHLIYRTKNNCNRSGECLLVGVAGACGPRTSQDTAGFFVFCGVRCVSGRPVSQPPCSVRPEPSNAAVTTEVGLIRLRGWVFGVS